MNRQTIFKFCLATICIAGFAFLFVPFYAELLLAGIFALAMDPVLGRWMEPKRFRRKISVALTLGLMFHAIALPLSYVAYRTYRYVVLLSETGFQNTEFFQKLLAIKSKVVSYVDALSVRLGLEAQVDFGAGLDDGLSAVINFIIHGSTVLIAKVPSLLLSSFVFCAALFYFLAEARTIKTFFVKQRLLGGTETARLIAVLQNASYSTVVTSLAIAAIQASIVAAGSLIFSTGEWAVVWAITFFCSFIPVVGAAPVALVLGLVRLVLGDVGPAIGLLVVGIIAGTTDNLVRPLMISSGDQDLNPVVSLLAIVGALLLFGMPGLFLGPVIAGVAFKIIPALFDPYPIDAKEPKKVSR